MSAARGLWATFRAALADAGANRAALGWQMVVMAVNDVVWVAFWVLFFRGVGTVRGWDEERIMLLLAVLTTSGGISLGLLANARQVGATVTGDGLDALLTLPVPPLAHLLLRRVEPVNLGDLAFGLVLFVVAGHPTPGRTLTFLAVVAASATLMTSFMVLTGSAAFFIGRNEGGELGFQAMLTMGAYPVDVFAGTARVLLHTVVPAAFVSSVPARLIEDPSLGTALGLAAIAGAFALAAWVAFHLGLRRYTSGAAWTRA